MKTKKRFTSCLLSIVLVLVMVMGLMPMTVSAASTPTRYDLDNPYIDTGLYFDGNGTHLYIDDGTVEGLTVIYYLDGAEKVYLNKNGEAGEDLSGAIVSGASCDQAFFGDTYITMNGGTVNVIYGGSSNGVVTGTVNVSINGGKVFGVYGTHSSKVSGDSNITITGGEIDTVSVAAYVVSCYIEGNANLCITGGTIGTVLSADGSHPVNGTVSGMVLSGKIHSTTSMDQLIYFDHLIYKDGANWVTKGKPEIPADTVLTISTEETFTVSSGSTISNNGTIVNNGTIINNGTFSGGKLINNGNLILKNVPGDTTLENNGTVIHHAVYVEDVDNVSSLNKVMKDNAEITPTSYVFNNRLYIFTEAGHIMAEVNGQKYHGVYEGNGELQLSTTFVQITGIEGAPIKAWKNMPITLPASASPDNASVPVDIIWECTSGNATLDGNVLTPTAASGTLQLKATVKNGLGYGTDYTKTYELPIQEGNVFNIENGKITITGQNDGSAIVKHQGKTTTIKSNEVIIITGEHGINKLAIEGGRLTVQFDNLNLTRTAALSPNYTSIKNAELNIILTGENTPQLSNTNSNITISGNGVLNANSTIDLNGDTGSITFNGGYVNATAAYGSLYANPSAEKSVIINGGTLRMQNGATPTVKMIIADTLIINGGNLKADTLNVSNLINSDGETLKYAEITLEGISDDVEVTDITGIEYGLENVKTIDGKLYVYASDVEKITSITAGGKTYVGQLIESGSKLYDWDDEKTTTMYTGTFFEGSYIDITGVVAEDAAYDGQSHQGYKGTISNSGGYTGEYTITYTGRNTTEYNSTSAPINGGDYTVTISAVDKEQKVAGVLSLDFTILPMELKRLTVELSEENFVYDGTEKKPTVTLKDENGVTLSPESYPYDVSYQDNINAGTGFVIVKSKENPNYTFKATASIDIAKADYDMTGAKWKYTEPFKYDGKEHKVEVVGLPTGVTVESYENNTATAVGDYYAEVNLTYDAHNYNAPTISKLGWTIYNDWSPTEYTTTTPNGNGWLNSDFVITANDGYKVSLTNTADGDWEDALAYSEVTADGSVTFYLKNETDGTISLAKTVYYKLDKTTPSGKVEFVNRTGWEEFVNTITFGMLCKDEVTIQVTANDDLSGVAKIEYASSDKAMTLDEVKAISDWTEYNGEFGVTLEDAKKFVYFIRITDKAGNMTYISTDGAEYDTSAPVIEGAENGEICYTTQKVTITDKNMDTITFNGEPAVDNIILDGNKEATYTIVATDKAGNITTVIVTMKPIKELAKVTENLGNDNVTSADAPALKELVEKLDELIADPDTSDDGEKETLEQHKHIAETLLKTIEDAAKATDTENTEKVENVTPENATPENKSDLEGAKADLEKALEDNGGNYTEDEKKAIKDEIKRIDDALEVIGNVEAVEESISKLPAVDTVKPDDEEAIKAITDAQTAYNALSDYEKSLVDEATKANLDKLVAALVAYDIVEGDGSFWTVDSDHNITFVVNGLFSKFVGIKIDGKDVDKADYEVKAGSTIITLKASYLDTLAVGEHTISVVYTDGSTDGTFNVHAKANSSATGDNSNMFLWIVLLFISGGTVITLIGIDKKRRSAVKK